LLVPALLGHAIGVQIAGSWSWDIAGLSLLFTVLDLGFIVLLNDWGDEKVDRIKRERFPDGCSPKTIPDGILPAASLLRVGLLLGAGAIAVSLWLAWGWERPLQTALGVSCVFLFVAYTLPPLKLNYRGGGELLEGIGVGWLLPIWHLYAMSGIWEWRAQLPLLGFVVFALASAIASGLSDEETDRLGGKRTFTTVNGNERARRVIEALVVLGACLWIGSALALAFLEPDVLWARSAGYIGAALLALVSYRRMRLVSKEARTNAFREQGRYKKHLHHAMWRGTTWLAIVLIVETLWLA